MIYEGLVSCENAARVSVEMDALKAQLAKAHAEVATARASAPQRKSSPAQDAAAAIRKTEKAAKDAQRAVDALAKSEARAAAAGERSAGTRARLQSRLDAAQARAAAADTRTQARTAATGERIAAAKVRQQSRLDAAQARADAAQFKGLNSFSAKGGGTGPVSPWATHAKKTADEEANVVAARNARMKAAMRDAAKIQQGGAGGSGSKKKDSDSAGGSGTPKDLKYLLKHAGIGKAAMGAMGAAAGLELSKLALGYRGMAMLGAISQRTGLQIRGLFSGVNPMPVVRAADKFSQLFNKAGPAGKALSSIFDHAFNSLFGMVEKAEPTIQAFFEGAIVGALNLETSWYRMRMAIMPITDAIDAIDTGNIDAIGTAADIAAAPFRVLAGLIDGIAKAIKVMSDAYKAIDWTGAPAWLRPGGGEPPAPAGSGPAGGGATGGAAAAGQPTGKAYADGIQVGVDAGLPGVAGAGKRIVDTLDKSTRAAGEIHSPSQKAKRTGRQFPAGTAEGIDDGAGDVAAAAARSMVPGGGSSGGASSPAMSGASFPAEALALLRQIADNTRPRSDRAGRATGGWGEAIHEVAHILGVPA